MVKVTSRVYVKHVKGLFNSELLTMRIFGDHALHRNYLAQNCEVELRSLEFRLIIPEQALPDKEYFDLKTQNFQRFNTESEMIPLQIS
jgi:hypothetical protein